MRAPKSVYGGDRKTPVDLKQDVPLTESQATHALAAVRKSKLESV